jgi:acyl-CoA synthetase (AMP-forming)/AMP-acid ligase II
MHLPHEAPDSVFEAFAGAAARYGALPCLAVLPETAKAYGIAAGELSYREALVSVLQLIEAYRAQGYGHGHRVALLLENRPAFFLHWYALNALGVCVVPINPELRSAELEYLLGHSEAVAVIAVGQRQADIARAAEAIGARLRVVGPQHTPPAIRAAPPRPGRADRSSECALLYTSGTTGRPKGCVLANEYFLYAGHWYANAGGLIAMGTGRERMLTPLPVFHMNAMAYSAMAMVARGGCLIALDRFHPGSWWQSVRESRASIVHYLGVMPPLLMSAEPSQDERNHSLRFGFGAGVGRGVHAQFERRFGFPLIEAWAMTETGAGAVVAAASEPRHTGTSCFGKPGPELEVRIVADDGSEAAADQPGELLVRHAGPDRGYGFFRGYLKDAEATAAAWQGGWFHTGDVVRRGPDGSLHFIDRGKNVIRRSGENISAAEVESVLVQHAAIERVAIAAVPDRVRGDEVFACVVAKTPPADRAGRERLAADIVAWCLERLAYFKAPGYVAFVAELPLTSTQKIQRGQLKEMVAAGLAGEACVDTRHLKKRAAA